MDWEQYFKIKLMDLYIVIPLIVVGIAVLIVYAVIKKDK